MMAPVEAKFSQAAGDGDKVPESRPRVHADFILDVS